jgi:hypothetical protein
MNIKRPYTGIGTSGDEGFLTFVVYPNQENNSFEVFREKEKSTTLSYEKNNSELTIQVSGKNCPHILNIALDKKPRKVVLDGKELIEGSDFEYNLNSLKLKVKISTYESGNYQIQL